MRSGRARTGQLGNPERLQMPSNRVLVVEDDPSVRGLLQTILEDEALEVIVAADGEEGLQLAQTVDPDVVLLDVMMPDVDGPAVYAQLRPLLGEAVPIIFLTAKDEHERLLALGAAGVIAKPFDPISLPREVAAITAR